MLSQPASPGPAQPGGGGHERDPTVPVRAVGPMTGRHLPLRLRFMWSSVAVAQMPGCHRATVRQPSPFDARASQHPPYSTLLEIKGLFILIIDSELPIDVGARNGAIGDGEREAVGPK